jgi:hypothetical protein
MTKKYSKFLLLSSENFDLKDFPYYWITQVHAQGVKKLMMPKIM